MSSIELTIENSCDLLRRFIDAGYKSTGVVSIKEGAILHRYFRILKGQEKDETLSEKEIYKIVFKVLDAFNAAKAYTLDDAAVIDKVVTFVEQHLEQKSKPPPVQTEKIVEI
jgi:hypothetical protein